MNKAFDSFINSPLGLLAVFGVGLFGCMVFFAAVILAVAVKRDVERRSEREAVVFLMGADAWCFVVLASVGFFGAMAYWLIHYSALRYTPHVPTKSPESRARPILEKSRLE